MKHIFFFTTVFLIGGAGLFPVYAQTVVQKPKIDFKLENSRLTWKVSNAKKCTASTDVFNDSRKKWVKEIKDRQWAGSKPLKGSKKIKESSSKKLRYKLACTKTVKRGRPMTTEAIVMNPKKWPSDQKVKISSSLQLKTKK